MDCSKWERDAFSECIAAKAIPTVGHCISTSIIYKNNTPYSIVKSEDGLFCISKDNFPERNWFLDQGVSVILNMLYKLKIVFIASFALNRNMIVLYGPSTFITPTMSVI